MDQGTGYQYSCVDGVWHANIYEGASCNGDYESLPVNYSSVSCSSSGHSCDYSMFELYIEGGDTDWCVDPNSGDLYDSFAYVTDVCHSYNDSYSLKWDCDENDSGWRMAVTKVWYSSDCSGSPDITEISNCYTCGAQTMAVQTALAVVVGAL